MPSSLDMDCGVVDCGGGVVVGKRMKQRHRGGRNRKLEAFFRVSEIVAISLVLLFHYSSGVSAAGEFLKKLVCLSTKPLHAFFVCNIIVLAIAVLSGVDGDRLRIGGWKKGRRGAGGADGIYDEYVARRRMIAVGGSEPEVSPVVGDVPEDEKQIVLFTSSGASSAGGKGSRTVTDAACDCCTKNGCPRRGMKAETSPDGASLRGRGRLVLRGVVGEQALKEPAAAARDGTLSKSPEKFTNKTEPRRTTRLALPDIITRSAATSASSMAENNIILKSLSKVSISMDKASPTVAITIGASGAQNSPRQKAMEASSPTDIPSPRGRGRLMVVREVGINTVDDMSNDEFNQNVEKYIAKTRRFLREESMRETNLDTLYRVRSGEHGAASDRAEFTPSSDQDTVGLPT